jgi:spore coat protein U-like protein
VGAVAALVMGPAASANTASTSVGIVSNVGANCIASANPITFGNYSPLNSQPLIATGALIITCTQDATPSVAMSLGANPSGSTRRMAAGLGNYLPYRVLAPTAPTPNASCSGAITDYPAVAPGFTLSPAPSFAPRTFTVCGLIAPGIDAPVGNYSDTLQATISF